MGSNIFVPLTVLTVPWCGRVCTVFLFFSVLSLLVHALWKKNYKIKEPSLWLLLRCVYLTMEWGIRSLCVSIALCLSPYPSRLDALNVCTPSADWPLPPVLYARMCVYNPVRFFPSFPMGRLSALLLILNISSLKDAWMCIWLIVRVLTRLNASRGFVAFPRCGWRFFRTFSLISAEKRPKT